MRTLFTLCLVVASLMGRAQSIPLDSFFVPGATWTQAWEWSLYTCSHCYTQGVDKVLYRIQSDTMIAGTRYHMLAAAVAGGYSFGYNNSFGPYTPSFKLFGRIRTDNNKVYFIQDSNSSYMQWLALGREYLIYDFNLAVGGSITRDDTFSTCDMVVSGIDSVTLSDGRRIGKFNNSAIYKTPYWLYGIGSPWGLLPRMYGTIFHFGPGPAGSGEYTLCYDNPSFNYHYQYTEDILYGNFESNCFDFNALSISSPYAAASGEFTFYPIPVAGDEISFKGDGADNVSAIKVVDILGTEVAYFSQPRKEQPLQLQLSPGVYLIHAWLSDGKTIVKRVVKL